MISKELLGEVLDVEVKSFQHITDEDSKCHNNVFIVICEEAVYSPSIWELAHKCKEWALKQSISLTVKIKIFEDERIRPDYQCFINTSEATRAKTEPEAIFKACQWIKDNT